MRGLLCFRYGSSEQLCHCGSAKTAETQRSITPPYTDNAPHRSHNTVLPVTAHFSQQTNPQRFTGSTFYQLRHSQLSDLKTLLSYQHSFHIFPICRLSSEQINLQVCVSAGTKVHKMNYVLGSN